MLDPFSAYNYDQKADKDDFPIFENISFFGPSNSRGHPGGPKILFDLKNHFNVLKMAKLELPNQFGSILEIINTRIKRGRSAQMT